MKYALFSLASGTAIAWFDSEEESADAVLQLAETEPEAIDNIGLTLFDERGRPEDSLHGEELLEAAREFSRSGVLAY
jgi:hypothetical protein